MRCRKDDSYSRSVRWVLVGLRGTPIVEIRSVGVVICGCVGNRVISRCINVICHDISVLIFVFWFQHGFYILTKFASTSLGTRRLSLRSGTKDTLSIASSLCSHCAPDLGHKSLRALKLTIAAHFISTSSHKANCHSVLFLLQFVPLQNVFH